MVRIKQKKAKGDDAFEKRKQKTGRKKLQPATDTRAEVHARSLFISTSSSISRAAQSLNAPPFGKEGAYDESVSSFSNPRAIKKQSVHELLRGITHYKSTQRSSSFVGVCRLLLQADKRRKKERVEEAARNILGFPFRKPSPLDGLPPKDPNSVVKSQPDDEEAQDWIAPIEKLTVFTAALEAMTDTEEAVRAAALSVLQALFREGWVCPQTPQEEALEDQKIAYRYYASSAKDGQPSPPEWTTTTGNDVVWMLVSSHASSKSSYGKANTGHCPRDGSSGKESSHSHRAASSLLRASSLSTPIPPVCAALCMLHANRAVPVLSQAAAWWGEEVGVVPLEAILRESVEEKRTGWDGSRPTGVSSGEGLPRHALHAGKESSELRRAVQKVALENVTAILHTIYICLTHAFYPVRCSGIELLESLLLLLQLESKRVIAQGGVDHYQGLFRQACRMVRRKQHLSGEGVASLAPTDHHAHSEKVGKDTKSDLACGSERGPTAGDRTLEVLYSDEIWMLHLLRRVSHLVLRTPHVPVLASVVEALFLSSQSTFGNEEHRVGGGDCGIRRDHKGNGEDDVESPVDILASLMRHDSSSLSSSLLSSATHPLRALWSVRGSSSLTVASSSEWCHAHLVQSAFAHVFLSPWSIAWKELMDQRVDLLRQEPAMVRAVAIGRVVTAVTTFLRLRGAAFGSASSTSGNTSPTHASASRVDWEIQFPSPFVPSAAPLVPSVASTVSSPSPTLEQRAARRPQVRNDLRTQEKKCQQVLVDIFVRHVPFSLSALLQDTTEDLAAACSTAPPKESMSPHHTDHPSLFSSSSHSFAPPVVDHSTRKKQRGSGGQKSATEEVASRRGEENERSPKVDDGRKRERSPSWITEAGAPSCSPRPAHANVSPSLLRLRSALAQSLVTVAATLLRYFPEASKLVHLYFSIVFPPPFPSREGGEDKRTSSDKAVVSSIASPEVLSEALGVLLLVLQLHPPCVSSFAGDTTSLCALASNATFEGPWRTGGKKASGTLILDNSAASRRRQQRDMQDLHTYHKTLLYTPSVMAVVLKVMKQHPSRHGYRQSHGVEGSGERMSPVAMSASRPKTFAVESREGKGTMDVYDRLQSHFMTSGVEVFQGGTTTLLSSTDSALVHLLLGARQLLLALAKSTALFLRIQHIPPSTYARENVAVRGSGLEMEVFKSLHRVWLTLPRLLFSLRLQWTGGCPPPVIQDDTSEAKKRKKGEPSQAFNEEENLSEGEREKNTERKEKNTQEDMKASSDGSLLQSSSSPLLDERFTLPIGPLPSHPALIDLIVFSYLHAMWFLIRRHHPLLECSSKEGEAVKEISWRDGGRKGAAAERTPSCLEVVANTLSSLKGFRLPPSSSAGKADGDGKIAVVQGVLSRCTPVTRRLAQRLAFYLGDTSSDFLLQRTVLDPIAGKEAKEVVSSDSIPTMCEMDMICVKHYLNSFVCHDH